MKMAASINLFLPSYGRRSHSRDGCKSSSSSSCSSTDSWPFGVIRSSTSESDLDTKIVICPWPPAPKWKEYVKVPLPCKPAWPTKETFSAWEKRMAMAANFTIICLDSSVATLVLDGEAWRRAPWELIGALPVLAEAIRLAPSTDEVIRIRESVKAFE